MCQLSGNRQHMLKKQKKQPKNKVTERNIHVKKTKYIKLNIPREMRIYAYEVEIKSVENINYLGTI